MIIACGSGHTDIIRCIISKSQTFNFKEYTSRVLIELCKNVCSHYYVYDPTEAKERKKNYLQSIKLLYTEYNTNHAPCQK